MEEEIDKALFANQQYIEEKDENEIEPWGGELRGTNITLHQALLLISILSVFLVAIALCIITIHGNHTSEKFANKTSNPGVLGHVRVKRDVDNGGSTMYTDDKGEHIHGTGHTTTSQEKTRIRDSRHIPEEIIRYYLMLLEHIKEQSDKQKYVKEQSDKQKYVNISVQEGSVGKKFIESVTNYLNKGHNANTTASNLLSTANASAKITKSPTTSNTQKFTTKKMVKVSIMKTTSSASTLTNNPKVTSTQKKNLVIIMKAPTKIKGKTTTSTTPTKQPATGTPSTTSRTTNPLFIIENLHIKETTLTTKSTANKAVTSKSTKDTTTPPQTKNNQIFIIENLNFEDKKKSTTKPSTKNANLPPKNTSASVQYNTPNSSDVIDNMVTLTPSNIATKVTKESKSSVSPTVLISPRNSLGDVATASSFRMTAVTIGKKSVGSVTEISKSSAALNLESVLPSVSTKKVKIKKTFTTNDDSKSELASLRSYSGAFPAHTTAQNRLPTASTTQLRLPTASMGLPRTSKTQSSKIQKQPWSAASRYLKENVKTATALDATISIQSLPIATSKVSPIKVQSTVTDERSLNSSAVQHISPSVMNPKGLAVKPTTNITLAPSRNEISKIKTSEISDIKLSPSSAIVTVSNIPISTKELYPTIRTPVSFNKTFQSNAETKSFPPLNSTKFIAGTGGHPTRKVSQYQSIHISSPSWDKKLYSTEILHSSEVSKFSSKNIISTSASSKQPNAVALTTVADSSILETVSKGKLTTIIRPSSYFTPPFINRTTLQATTIQSSVCTHSPLINITLQATTIQSSMSTQPPLINITTLQATTIQSSVSTQPPLINITLQATTIQSSVNTQPPLINVTTLQATTIQSSVINRTTLQPTMIQSSVSTQHEVFSSFSKSTMIGDSVNIKVPSKSYILKHTEMISLSKSFEEAQTTVDSRNKHRPSESVEPLNFNHTTSSLSVSIDTINVKLQSTIPSTPVPFDRTTEFDTKQTLNRTEEFTNVTSSIVSSWTKITPTLSYVIEPVKSSHIQIKSNISTASYPRNRDKATFLLRSTLAAYERTSLKSSGTVESYKSGGDKSVYVLSSFSEITVTNSVEQMISKSIILQSQPTKSLLSYAKGSAKTIHSSTIVPDTPRESVAWNRNKTSNEVLTSFETKQETPAATTRYIYPLTSTSTFILLKNNTRRTFPSTKMSLPIKILPSKSEKVTLTSKQSVIKTQRISSSTPSPSEQKSSISSKLRHIQPSMSLPKKQASSADTAIFMPRVMDFKQLLNNEKQKEELIWFIKEIMKNITTQAAQKEKKPSTATPTVTTTTTTTTTKAPTYKLGVTCRNDSTLWETAKIIGWFNFLQSQRIRCKDYESLKHFELVDDKDIPYMKYRYNFVCCAMKLYKETYSSSGVKYTQEVGEKK